MSDFSFEAIPRFKSGEANEFPWANCTEGEEPVKVKFALLARLGIPLGNTINDAICRNRILQSLLLFEESNGNKKHKIVANNHKITGHCIKIPCGNKNVNGCFGASSCLLSSLTYLPLFSLQSALDNLHFQKE